MRVKSAMLGARCSAAPERMLFPVPGDGAPALPPRDGRVGHAAQAAQLNFYNRTLNGEQQTAVVGILQSVARPAPYLIYGPPGACGAFRLPGA